MKFRRIVTAVIVAMLLVQAAPASTASKSSSIVTQDGRSGRVAGTGRLLQQTIASPAAGAQAVALAVPVGKVWRIVGARLQLVTSATVAARIVNVVFDDGANTLFENSAFASQAASNTYKYFVSAAPMNGAVNGRIQIAIPPDFFLQAGYRISFFVTAIDTTDAVTAIIVYVEEWDA